MVAAKGVFAVVFALEVKTEEDSGKGGEEEDDYHYDPTVVLIYPVRGLAPCFLSIKAPHSIP